MAEKINYVPISNPYRGFDVLLFIRGEGEQQVGQAVIWRNGGQVMTIEKSEYLDFDVAKADVLARANKWIDEKLAAS